MAVSDTLINTLFDGRYRVLRKLGTGGMANVYLAEDEELGRRVAIKVLDERHASDEQFVERFRREAKSAAALSHPNIVSIYDRGEARGAYYIAMEYLEGRTLKELIARHGPLSIRTAVGYARQILAALRFAHRHGLVHRDIKPHNVLVDVDGRLKVADFGIARSNASQLTEAGSIIGTAQYLSPEQARGAPVDQRSDLYSLGVVLYELLTGVVPFAGDTPVEIAMKHLSGVPEPPSKKRTEVSRDLDMVVIRSLAKRPDERYQSAEEMDADLARVERGLAVSDETAEAATAVLSGRGLDATMIETTPVLTPRPPPRPGPYYEYEPPVRRRPLWPWLLALLLLVAAGIGGWYAFTELREELNAAKPVAVPFVEGMVEPLAVSRIVDADLHPRVRRLPNADVVEGRVYDQMPDGGEKLDRGNTVVILVSLGPPKVGVPELIGEPVDEAQQALRKRGLKPKIVEIFSEKPVDTVIGQAPRPGTTVEQGSTVRLNVSQGPKPIAVPPVVGESFEDAAGELQAAEFAVARADVDSNEPAGTVVGQDPAANSLQPRGATVTLSVSRGPKTSAVPDVVGLEREAASAQLKNAGFRALVQEQETEDEGEDGIVLAQDPLGGTQQARGTTVLITIGRLVDQTPTETETETDTGTETTP
jgi:eukaryotic-like serine/threonine-protein kinase